MAAGVLRRSAEMAGAFIVISVCWSCWPAHASEAFESVFQGRDAFDDIQVRDQAVV